MLRAHKLAREIARITTRPWSADGNCGGQTHAIVIRHRRAAAEANHADSRPRVPVCVTPLELIDQALGDCCPARGDLLLVWRHAARAGSGKDLLSVKAGGGDVAHQPIRRWTPVKLVGTEPARESGLLRVGFENHRARHGDGRHRPPKRGSGTSRCWWACAGAARHRGDSVRAGLPGARASSPPATSAQ